ncbi:F-box domain-containing protein [Mycena kentingensis (nom. inval.)]|nr:F-box domain-containing protein [Mycena kentingensis (nom. inval.)]
MDNSLPDELISEILSPALKVSDEAFSNNHSDVSPFATYSESPSAYLLVNKAWLRVATPLIYNVVVLRSAPQAKALARALTKNEQLAWFIKKLRVEGGFGVAMKTILSLASNITDLFLSLDIFSMDNTEGLCKGLTLVSPTRLILQHSNYNQKDNKYYRNLVNALTAAIGTWDKLVAFAPAPQYHSATFAKLAAAFNGQKRLQSLTFASIFAAASGYSKFIACPIRDVHFSTPLMSSAQEILDDRPALKALARFKMETEPSPVNPLSPPSLNPLFKPMANAPKEIQDRIWSRVLLFTMSLPKPPRRAILSFEALRTGDLHLLLVSKTFYTVGLPHLHANIVLGRTRHPMKIAATLKAHPLIADHIRTIHCNPDGYNDEDELDIFPYYRRRGQQKPPTRSDAIPALRIILTQAKNLHTLNLLTSKAWSTEYDILFPGVEFFFPWSVLADLARSAGSNLRELAVNVSAAEDVDDVTAGDVFRSFTVLQKLRWKSSLPLGEGPTSAGAPVFPQLEQLEIEYADQTFLEVLAVQRPPRLRRLILWEDSNIHIVPFLRDCGAGITEVDISAYNSLSACILDLCPDLVVLNLKWSAGNSLGPPAKAVLKPVAPANKITTINFHVGRGRFRRVFLSYFTLSLLPLTTLCRYQKDPTEWPDFLTTLPFDSMPNLDQIFVEGFIWPTNQRDIVKSEWVRTAEALLKKEVHMVDSDGHRWRSRLRR